MSPMPLADGQISGLISFIIQAWCPAPSVEPASVTYWTHLAGLSRQNIQPWNDAVRNLVAMSSLPGLASHAARAQRASWSMAVPTSLKFDDVQVLRLVELARVGVGGLQHLRVLVVDHGLGGVDLLVQQQRHVERLDDPGVVGRVVERRGLLAGRGDDLVVVAEVPDADLLALPVGRRRDAGGLPRDLAGARALEDLRDVDQVRLALVAQHEHLRHPGDGELGSVGVRADGLVVDRRAAGQQVDLEAPGPRSSPRGRPRSSRRTAPAGPTGAAGETGGARRRLGRRGVVGVRPALRRARGADRQAVPSRPPSPVPGCMVARFMNPPPPPDIDAASPRGPCEAPHSSALTPPHVVSRTDRRRGRRDSALLAPQCGVPRDDGPLRQRDTLT